jgi:predicted nucleic acid-binding protein
LFEHDLFPKSGSHFSGSCFSISIFEIRFGIEVLEKGRRQRRIEEAFERALLADFEERILVVDEPAAREAASLAARRQRMGRIVGIHDTLIAGIAVSRKADLATRNVRHFDDLEIRVMDPWSE